MNEHFYHNSNVEADPGSSPGQVDPLVWYEGSAQTDAARRILHADPRGSIVAVTNNAGTSIATNAYDGSVADRRRSRRTIWHPRHRHRQRYLHQGAVPLHASSDDVRGTSGAAQPGLASRARHVLLQACPERLACQPAEGARIYSPTLGRFLQTDPIGYEDQVNLYAYVANDPINGVDPTGLERNPLANYHRAKAARAQGQRAPEKKQSAPVCVSACIGAKLDGVVAEVSVQGCADCRTVAVRAAAEVKPKLEARKPGPEALSQVGSKELETGAELNATKTGFEITLTLDDALEFGEGVGEAMSSFGEEIQGRIDDTVIEAGVVIKDFLVCPSGDCPEIE